MTTFETLAFYRGVSDKYATNAPSIIAARRDRRPKNSSLHFHQIADAWFEKRFGVRYRSQSVFLTSRLLTATTYAASKAHVLRVLPLTHYRYCWSRNITDLLFIATKMEQASQTEIESCLDAARYEESGLKDAHDLGCEVMLHCDFCVGIPIGLLERPSESADGSAILLSPYAS